jgi:hypothetical protein
MADGLAEAEVLEEIAGIGFHHDMLDGDIRRRNSGAARN